MFCCQSCEPRTPAPDPFECRSSSRLELTQHQGVVSAVSVPQAGLSLDEKKGVQRPAIVNVAQIHHKPLQPLGNQISSMSCSRSSVTAWVRCCHFLSYDKCETGFGYIQESIVRRKIGYQMTHCNCRTKSPKSASLGTQQAGGWSHSRKWLGDLVFFNF